MQWPSFEMPIHTPIHILLNFTFLCRFQILAFQETYSLYDRILITKQIRLITICIVHHGIIFCMLLTGSPRTPTRAASPETSPRVGGAGPDSPVHGAHPSSPPAAASPSSSPPPHTAVTPSQTPVTTPPAGRTSPQHSPGKLSTALV